MPQQGNIMEITAMDYVRAILAHAQYEGMTLDDLAACAEHADDLPDWDDATNILAQTMPLETSVG